MLFPIDSAALSELAFIFAVRSVKAAVTVALILIISDERTSAIVCNCIPIFMSCSLKTANWVVTLSNCFVIPDVSGKEFWGVVLLILIGILIPSL